MLKEELRGYQKEDDDSVSMFIFNMLIIFSPGILIASFLFIMFNIIL